MKHLKKHPKQQRMEDMTFPMVKPGNWCYFHPTRRAVVYSGTPEANLCQECLDESLSKVIWEGREWLRSINDDNGFRLMPRLAWRVVAVGVLVGAVIYFLSKYGYIR